MSIKAQQPCPQLKRALRLLIEPNAPKLDFQLLRAALPAPTPTAPEDIIALIIQIILALMENKEADDKPKPEPQPNDFAELRRVAAESATETVESEDLKRDLPTLITAITTIQALIPVPGFASLRAAREAMRLATNKALGTSAQAWHIWNNDIKSEMNQLNEQNKLQDLADYKQAWLAVVTGLQSL